MHFGEIGKKFDIKFFSGQIREILILKNLSAFAWKRFSGRNFAFSKIFAIGIKKESIFPSETHF